MPPKEKLFYFKQFVPGAFEKSEQHSNPGIDMTTFKATNDQGNPFYIGFTPSSVSDKYFVTEGTNRNGVTGLVSTTYSGQPWGKDSQILSSDTTYNGIGPGSPDYIRLQKLFEAQEAQKQNTAQQKAHGGALNYFNYFN